MFTFQNLYFMILFTHKGLVNNFGHPFLFDPSSSCLVFAFLPSVSQMYFIESSPKPPHSFVFEGLQLQQNIHYFGKRIETFQGFFPKITCHADEIHVICGTTCTSHGGGTLIYLQVCTSKATQQHITNLALLQNFCLGLHVTFVVSRWHSCHLLYTAFCFTLQKEHEAFHT